MNQLSNSDDAEKYKERLEQTLSGINCGTFEHNFTTGLIYLDARAQRLLSLTKEYVTFDEWSGIINPLDLKILETIALGIQENKTHIDVTYRVFEGTESRYIRVNSFVKYNNGIPKNSFGLIQDVTGQRLREIKLENMEKKLQALSYQDSLTGISNRRAFDEAIEREWKRSVRDRTNCSLIMIDIDHFKLYNDEYGHLKGDNCLKMVADTLANIAKRDTDILARYGGEEFVILLPNTDFQSAQSLAEKCRKQVLALQWAHGVTGATPYVTISAGVSTIMPNVGSPYLSLIESADACLYQAKKKGRNCVIAFTPAL